MYAATQLETGIILGLIFIPLVLGVIALLIFDARITARRDAKTLASLDRKGREGCCPQKGKHVNPMQHDYFDGFYNP